MKTCESVVGKVYQTTNYGMFKHINGNRDIKEDAKFRDLMKSIKEKGQIEPAVVTYDYEVLNGQHRLVACEKLGVPYKYVFGSKLAGGVMANDIADANSSRAWSLKDYVNFWKVQPTQNAISYKYFDALCKESGLSHGDMVRIITNENRDRYASIRNGEFTLSLEKYEEVRKCLAYLSQLGFMAWQKETHVRQQAYWGAIVYAWKHPYIDMKRLINVMYKNQHKIASYTRVKDLLETLSVLYNKGLKVDQRVHMDVDFEQKKYTRWISDIQSQTDNEKAKVLRAKELGR